MNQLVNMSRRWLVAFVVSLCTASCGREQNAKNPGAPLAPSETREFQACAADDDCIYVQNGCCDCANGGADLAINKKFEKAFLAKRKCSEKFPCTLMGMIPACGSGKVSCTDGMCAYKLP